MKNFKQRNLDNLPKIVEVLNRHKHHIEKLRVVTFEFDPFLDQMPIVSNQLTHLSLQWCDLYLKATKNRDSKFDFPHLKFLRLHRTSAFINHIKSHKIEALEVDENEVSFKSGNWPEFLKTCENLKEFKIIYFFFDFDLSKLNLRLVKFELLEFANSRLEGGIEKVKNFLTSQKESLKDLTLEIHSIEVFKFVISKLHVETFKFLSIMREISGKVKFNRSIKNLSFKMKNSKNPNFRADAFYDQLATKLKAVETIEVEVDTMIDILFLYNIDSMRKMRNLSVTMKYLAQYTYHILEIVRIEGIENYSVKFQEDDNSEHRVDFLVICPNVKSLKIESASMFSANEFKTIIKSLDSLEEIYIEGRLEFNDEIGDLLLESNIRKITIVNNDETLELPKKLKHSKIKVLIAKKLKSDYEDFDNDLSSDESSEDLNNYDSDY